MNDDSVDDDFNAGFTEDTEGLTATPVPDGTTVAPVVEQAAPEYAQITKQEYQDLLSKAAAIDDIKAEYGKKFDSAFGKMGNMQQLIERLQSSTQQGQPLSVTEADFEELVNEGYPDLAQLTAAGLNRILGKTKLSGAAHDPGISQDRVGEIFQERFGSESAKLRESLASDIRSELALEAIEEVHQDFKEVVNSKEFQDWTKSNAINDKKDRKGTPFAESIDARFVGKIISDFKATQKQAATRQSRIAAAVQPRGAGGHAGGSDDNDEFLSGFNG